MPKLLIALLLLSLTGPALAKKVCKVSMMGRVCYEENAEAATSEHMKNDAVADAKSKQKVKLADAKSAK